MIFPGMAERETGRWVGERVVGRVVERVVERRLWL